MYLLGVHLLELKRLDEIFGVERGTRSGTEPAFMYIVARGYY